MRFKSMFQAALLVTVLGAASPTPAEPLVEAVAASPDLVVVLKSERIMYVYRDGIPIRSYPIALGKQPQGHKLREGDQRTPEGAYILDWRNPDSQFYKSIHISYPNARDLRRSAGRDVDLGGLIMIHGQPSYDDRPRVGDWTNGCIAVSNEAMDELWAIIPQDTPIHIYP